MLHLYTFLKVPYFHRTVHLKRAFLPSLVSGGDLALVQQGFQKILSYFLAKQLLVFAEHPRSRSCTRPDCSPQGQREHVSVQPMQWLKGWLCPWWISPVPGFSSLSHAPWLFQDSLTLASREWGGKGRISESLISQTLVLASKSYQGFRCKACICKHGPHSYGGLRVEGCFHSYRLGSWIWRVQVLVLPHISYAYLGNLFHLPAPQSCHL